MNDTERWIATYISENGRLEAPSEAVLDDNYFELELLDSLGIVQMIVGIEDELGARLESEQMQDPRFCTIRGLAEIVSEVKARD